MTHWSENYIGAGWRNGAQGPNDYDCYGLVRAVYATELGIDLPTIPVDARAPLAVRHAMSDHPEYAQWNEVTDFRDFDVALMSCARHPHHVGLFAEGRMLHAVEGAGVVRQSLSSLASHRWHIVRLYRRKSAA